MKIINKTQLPSANGGFTTRVLPCLTVMLATWASVSLVQAAQFGKANNNTALNVAGSWTNNAVPGAADIAQWDATVSSVNNTTNALGAGMYWGGIRILNPVANIQISAGSILTNGASGIDMTAATVDVAFSNTVQIAAGAQQQWNVAPGHTLSVLAIPTKPGQPGANTGSLQVGTTGTVRFGAVAATTIADNQGNPWVTYGQNDWAALDSSGNVIAATYTTASSTMTAGVFNDITGDIAGGAGSAIDIPGIRFNDSVAHTVSIANSGTSRTFTCRGILVTANCTAGGTIGGTATTSFIRPSRTTIANTSWNVIQNSPADFTIAAIISDGSSSAPNHLVKSGPGNLNLSNTGTSYTGGTDINGGTLTVAAGCRPGGGSVTVNNTGRLVVNASNTTFVASVAVNSGGTNRININTANAQQFISTVIFNAGSTACGFSYANGVGFSSTTAALLVSNVTANGSITVNIYGGSPALGVFPLIKYTNSLTGTGFPAFSLGLMPLRTTGYLSNDTANTSIDLVVTNISEPLDWATTSGTWDIAGTANWKDALGNITTYQQANGFGDAVVFEDSVSGAGPITVTLNANPTPATVTVNASKNYTISGNGGITGGTSLIKSSSGTLTLSTTNTFTGGLYLTNGIVNFSSVTNLGNGGINFYGGTLQYAAGNVDDVSVRGIYFGSATGTIDDGGNAITFANPIGNSGTGSFVKAGAGTLTLAGTNKYSGNTVVANGTLALAANTFISNSAAIIVNGGAVLDTASSGVGLTLKGSPAQIVAGTGTINGTVISSNGVITPGTNGVYGTLTFGNDLTVSGGSLVLDVSTTNHDLIAVGGNLTLNSGSLQVVNNSSTPLTNGVYRLMTYASSLVGGAGSVGNLNLNYSQAGKSAVLSGATSGEIDLIIANSAGDVISWSGTSGSTWDTTGSQNWLLAGATPWAYTNGDAVTLDNLGTGQPNVSLQDSVTPSSIIVSNDAATYDLTDGTGTGGGKIAGATGIVKKGGGTLILETANVNTGSLVISNGTVQVGNGAGGDLGPGNITNNAALVFDQGDVNTHLVAGQVSGTGSLTMQGSSTVILAANNTYAGPTTVSAGTLQVGNGGATGSLGSGAVTNDGTLIYNHTGTFAVGGIKAGPANGGALTFNGAATVTLNNGSTYINNTTIDNGLVKLSAADAIPSGVTVTGSTGWLVLDGGISAAGTLDINGLNISVNALSGLGNTVNGVITNGATSATTTNVITVLGTAATAYNGAINDSAAGSKIGLTLLGINELRLNGTCNYSGPTLVASGATLGVGPGYVNGTGITVLSNGATFYMHNNGSATVSPGNSFVIPDNSVGIFYSSSTGNTIGNSATVSGDATATNAMAGTAGSGISFNAPAVKQFESLYGTVVISNSQSLRFSSTSLTVNGGDNTTFDVEGTLSTRNGTATGAGISLGALTGAGTVSGGGSSPSTGSLYVIGAKGVASEFTGTIQDGGAGNSAVTKTGLGRQTLDGTLSYTGNTTVNQGTLQIASAGGSTSLDTSSTITIVSNATLDVSGRSDSTLNLGNSIVQTLTVTGGGNITGNLSEANTTTNNFTSGVLAVSGNATIDNVVKMQFNRTNSPTCSELSAGGAITVNGGTLTVTNGGPDLVTGDVFHLFNKGITGAGFSTISLPVQNVGATITYVYETNLVTAGSSPAGTIKVLVGASALASYPTNITATVTGGNLTVSWPQTHLGWELEVQTNSINTGLGNNWVTNTGTSSVTSTNYPINPANGTVFFRLVHP